VYESYSVKGLLVKDNGSKNFVIRFSHNKRQGCQCQNPFQELHLTQVQAWTNMLQTNIFISWKNTPKKCLDPLVKEGGNGKLGNPFNIVIPFKVWKKLHYFLKYHWIFF
jgi:hypothetical protein